MEVTLADDGEAPAPVLRERVKHVVEEADARVDADRLRLARLGGVVVAGLEEARVRVRGEVAAVEVQRHLDLGLVGVARDGGPAGRVRRHCGRCGGRRMAFGTEEETELGSEDEVRDRVETKKIVG